MTEQSIFYTALEIEDRAARAAYLDDACAANSALRCQIESLLAVYERSGKFLDVPAVAQIAPHSSPADELTEPFHVCVEREERSGAQDDDQKPEDTVILPRDEDTENIVGLLQPSSKPGSLGRLGHYEILELVGRGGFGVVLKAFDEALHRVVAI